MPRRSFLRFRLTSVVMMAALLLAVTSISSVHAATGFDSVDVSMWEYDDTGSLSRAPQARAPTPARSELPAMHYPGASFALSLDSVVPRRTRGAGGAFHYTSRQSLASIEKKGLLPGSYATSRGDLSPLQAQIDLALPPNRGLRDVVVRVDLAGLRKAGYEVPEFTLVGRNFNMPGGGTEIQFNYALAPEFLTVVRP